MGPCKKRETRVGQKTGFVQEEVWNWDVISIFLPKWICPSSTDGSRAVSGFQGLWEPARKWGKHLCVPLPSFPLPKPIAGMCVSLSEIGLLPSLPWHVFWGVDSCHPVCVRASCWAAESVVDKYTVQCLCGWLMPAAVAGVSGAKRADPAGTAFPGYLNRLEGTRISAMNSEQI